MKHFAAILLLTPLLAAMPVRASLSDGHLVVSCADGKAEYPAGLENQIKTYDEFSKSFLGVEWAKQPEFVKSWISQAIDQDENQEVSAAEFGQVVCDLQNIFVKELPSVMPGPLVNSQGNTDWLNFYAAGKSVTGMHLKLALGAYGRDWVKSQLLTGESAESRSKIDAYLQGGRWSVAEKEPAQQFDLLGADGSEEARLRKGLELAYRVSEYKKTLGEAQWSVLKSKLVSLSEKQGSFPFVQYVSKTSVTLGFNKVTTMGIGVEGALRYYVLLGQPLTLTADKPDVWGQPSDQVSFSLAEAKAYPATDRFVAGVRRQIKTLLSETCRGESPNSPDKYQIYRGLQDDRKTIEGRLQLLSDSISDQLGLEGLQIEVLDESLEGSDRAHLNVENNKIQFSWGDLMAVKDSGASLEDLNRHIQFVLMHESIHGLQAQSNSYGLNQDLYNKPSLANMLYGSVGTAKFYLAQPLEKDAQGLAVEFVQALQKECKVATL